MTGISLRKRHIGLSVDGDLVVVYMVVSMSLSSAGRDWVFDRLYGRGAGSPI
jgi:hypothetical protein